MSIIPKLYKTDGFTLLEALVVLIVGSLLLNMCLLLFLFTSSFFSTWRERNEMRFTAENILQLIVYDVQRSKEIMAMTDSSFALLKGISSRIEYAFDARLLRRNNVEIRIPVDAELILKLNLEPNIRNMVEIAVVLKSRVGEYSSNIRTKLEDSSVQRFNSTSM